MAEFKEAIFAHYRTVGFPYYDLSEDEKSQKFESLRRYDHTTVISPEGVVKQTMHGLALAWHYHPHQWCIPCGEMFTPMQVFADDTLFRKAIAKRIKLGTYMTDSGIRKGIRSFSGTQSVSNFRPTAAAAIYHRYLPPQGVTWDMSSGFGGRLLGALACDRVGTYIGTDPNSETMEGLEQMKSEFGRDGLQIKLYKVGSEDFHPEPESLDLCFTSPPYFNTEKYSEELPRVTSSSPPRKNGWGVLCSPPLPTAGWG